MQNRHRIRIHDAKINDHGFIPSLMPVSVCVFEGEGQYNKPTEETILSDCCSLFYSQFFFWYCNNLAMLFLQHRWQVTFSIMCYGYLSPLNYMQLDYVFMLTFYTSLDDQWLMADLGFSFFWQFNIYPNDINTAMSLDRLRLMWITFYVSSLNFNRFFLPLWSA